MFTKRLIAGFIDYLIAAIIQFFLMFGTIIIPLIIFQDKTAFENIIQKMVLLTSISMLYLVLRDILGEKSIGKKIMKIKIVNLSGEKTSITQRLVRNLTWILGTIEIVVLLSTKFQYRIGDKIARTKIEVN